MKKTLAALGTVVFVLCLSSPASARSIKSQLENTLFGAQDPIFLTIDTPGGSLVLLSTNPDRFGKPIGSNVIGPLFTNALAGEVLTESAVVPVPSGSGGFSYIYNPTLNIFERQSIGLGTIFNERVNTLGKGTLALGVAYIRQDFDKFNGEDLSDLDIRKGLFAKQQFLGDILDPGVVKADVELDIITNSVALYGIYGVTDWLDVSLLLPITEISVRAESRISQGTNNFQIDVPVFLPDPFCNVERAREDKCRISDFTILRKGTKFTFGSEVRRDTVDETRTGVGDMLVRGKARFLESDWGAFGGLVEFTLPTGDEDNFLGDDAFKARFLLLYSQRLFANRLNFHLNGGGRVTTQTSDKNTIEYGSTVDFMVSPGLSLVAELIGLWRGDSGGLPDNFIDGAFGVKANIFRNLIANLSFRIPATEDGLRSNLLYLVGVEYDF